MMDFKIYLALARQFIPILLSIIEDNAMVKISRTTFQATVAPVP